MIHGQTQIKQFSSSCTAYGCLSGFKLRSTDILGLRRDAAPYFFLSLTQQPLVAQVLLVI